MNMDGDLTSRNMNNGDNSNRDNPRFGNLRGKSKDNLRFSNQDNNLRRKSGSRKDKSKNPRSSNQDNNLRREFGNRKDKSKNLRSSNRNALSLKESLEVGSIEVEKAGRIKVRGDTTIRSNDIWQSLLLVEHLDGEKKGRAKKTRGTFIQSVLCRSPRVAGSRGIRIGARGSC
jgi:hypothetical protein